MKNSNDADKRSVGRFKLPDDILEYPKAVRELYRELGRNPSTEEVAERMKLSIDRIKYLETVLYYPPIIYPGMDKENSSDALDNVVAELPETIAGDTIWREKFKEMFKGLSLREQEILSMRFGLDNGIIPTLKEVGQKFGVTRERVRQIEAKALEKIRQHSGLKKLEGR